MKFTDWIAHDGTSIPILCPMIVHTRGVNFDRSVFEGCGWYRPKSYPLPLMRAAWLWNTDEFRHFFDTRQIGAITAYRLPVSEHFDLMVAKAKALDDVG